MLFSFSLFPEQASTFAWEVDALYVYLTLVSVFFTGLIVVLVAVFSVKYKRISEADVPPEIHGNTLLEITWSVIPLGIVMTFFVWGTLLFFKMFQAPVDAYEIFVVGKQWMWKIQHPTGKREINELHVPIGRPIKLTMTSEDVIHSFYIPAFRTKMDAVPGRYTQSWFQATKTGTFHLFCAEYCGTDHSRMIGQVHVVSPEQYESWLATGSATRSLVDSGEELFQTLRCNTCHRSDSGTLGPVLTNLYGSTVKVNGGHEVKADEAYIRESILRPTQKIVDGYQALMPTYQNQINEEQILALVNYIKSLKETPAAVTAPVAPEPAAPQLVSQ